MTDPNTNDAASPLRRALEAPDPSARLQAALTAGTSPDPTQIDALIERCAIEPDFYVRDMLTWALIHHDLDVVIARLLAELDSDIAQARSQALHTLSKIGRSDTWPAITTAHVQDQDDEVARAAWRTAAGLVPAAEAAALAEILATQFNRGGREMQLSLSRAFVELGAAAAPTVERMKTDPDADISRHAIATERLMHDPDEGFDAAMHEARQLVALRAAPYISE